ncbi:MAG: carbohydrate kinase [Verrucomicrobia bacterium]|nr:carbohydrate kinase [Verrucomicrobiota bacterium]
MKPKVLAVGEILWDLLPSGKQLGGAPANFAYHARALGAEARVCSRVGNDPLGREILGRLRSLGLPTDGVGVDATAPTGTVSVELAADGQPRFTIHENVAWDRLVADEASLAFAARADAVCFGSLAQRSEPSRGSIRKLVAATPATALRVFDINLRQQFFSREVVEESLRLANVLKLNDTELPVLAAMFGLTGGVREQLAALAERFGLRAVALTRGAHGSLLCVAASLRDADQDDGWGRSRSDRTTFSWSEHAGLSVKVVDSVGAGDAFTAAMALGLLAGRPLDEINRHANEVAAYVCSQPGATPVLPASFKERQ